MAVTEMARIETKGTRKRGLGTFFTLTFALTWGIAAVLIAAPDTVERMFGPIGLTNPLYLIAVYAPGISGIAVAWNRLGREGMRGFFARLGMASMPVWGWLVLVVGFPVIVYGGAALSGTFGDSPVFSPWYAAIPALLQSLLLAGTLEEFGWRGVALPLLQRRFVPLTAGLMLGVVHAVWHLPAFAMSGTIQSAWSFGPYFAGVVAWSVIFTSLFNASKGSLLIAWLVHFQAMNPLFTDGQPWDTLFYIVVAVALVIFDRRRMIGGADAVVGLQRPDDHA